MQFHDHACNLVGIYFDEAEVTQVVFYTTANNRKLLLVFKFCILHNIIVDLRYIQNSASCTISGLLAVRNECSFYSVKER
jgi:hypothetical protein